MVQWGTLGVVSQPRVNVLSLEDVAETVLGRRLVHLFLCFYNLLLEGLVFRAF